MKNTWKQKKKKMLFDQLLLEALDSWMWFQKTWRQFTIRTESRKLWIRKDGILQHTEGRHLLEGDFAVSRDAWCGYKTTWRTVAGEVLEAEPNLDTVLQINSVLLQLFFVFASHAWWSLAILFSFLWLLSFSSHFITTYLNAIVLASLTCCQYS